MIFNLKKILVYLRIFFLGYRFMIKINNRNLLEIIFYLLRENKIVIFFGIFLSKNVF